MEVRTAPPSLQPFSGDIDPLPSWRKTATKDSILAFVSNVTKTGGSSFIPPSERIAVFDNDGTLWPENPSEFEYQYAVDTLQQMLTERPELLENPMVKAALDGDLETLFASRSEGLLQTLSLVTEFHQ